MAAKKTVKTVAPVTAITKAKPAALAPAEVMTKAGNEYLTAASLVLSQTNLPTPVLVETFDQLKGYEDALADVVGVARGKLLDIIKEQGSGDSSLKLTVGGYEVSARPRKTGLDAKKLEALLRAKGIDPSSYMTTKVTYEVDPPRAEALVQLGKLTQDELNTCIPPLEYNLMRPKKV
jgi:hypothetical protein